jgi:hypothetical protein
MSWRETLVLLLLAVALAAAGAFGFWAATLLARCALAGGAGCWGTRGAPERCVYWCRQITGCPALGSGLAVSKTGPEPFRVHTPRIF